MINSCGSPSCDKEPNKFTVLAKQFEHKMTVSGSEVAIYKHDTKTNKSVLLFFLPGLFERTCATFLICLRHRTQQQPKQRLLTTQSTQRNSCKHTCSQMTRLEIGEYIHALGATCRPNKEAMAMLKETPLFVNRGLLLLKQCCEVTARQA